MHGRAWVSLEAITVEMICPDTRPQAGGLQYNIAYILSTHLTDVTVHDEEYIELPLPEYLLKSNHSCSKSCLCIYSLYMYLLSLVLSLKDRQQVKTGRLPKEAIKCSL